MRQESADYAVFPKIVEAGQKTAIVIRPLGQHVKFDERTDYRITVIPMCDSREGSDLAYDTILCRADSGSLILGYTFAGEQPNILRVAWLGHEQEERHIGDFMVYSLHPDLFPLRPYKGDFHVHTCRSDGREAPAVVAANYRKAGFDFMAITDHGQWEPSEEAISAYADVPVDLRIFHGEEVHPPENHVHMVNFGGKYSINRMFREYPECYREEVGHIMEEMMEEMESPEGVDAFEYASCVWCFDQIRRAGGLGIFCHPHWIANAYHVPEKLVDLLFARMPFDAFELLGGHESHSNNMQTAYYQEARAAGKRIPIVGVSDSHGTVNAPYFNWFYTIVFSADKKLENIIEAVKNLQSVAVEQYPGETFRIYGPYRLVKYADFLLNEYFPLHDELCVEEGRLMKAYACGDDSKTESLARLRGRTGALLERCFAG